MWQTTINLKATNNYFTGLSSFRTIVQTNLRYFLWIVLECVIRGSITKLPLHTQQIGFLLIGLFGKPNNSSIVSPFQYKLAPITIPRKSIWLWLIIFPESWMLALVPLYTVVSSNRVANRVFEPGVAASLRTNRARHISRNVVACGCYAVLLRRGVVPPTASACGCFHQQWLQSAVS